MHMNVNTVDVGYHVKWCAFHLVGCYLNTLMLQLMAGAERLCHIFEWGRELMSYFQPNPPVGNHCSKRFKKLTIMWLSFTCFSKSSEFANTNKTGNGFGVGALFLLNSRLESRLYSTYDYSNEKARVMRSVALNLHDDKRVLLSETFGLWTFMNNFWNTVHPRFSGPRLTGPSINRPGSTGRYIQLFCLKSTRFTVEKN